MLRNYLLITWRNFKRHKGFSLINVLGLSIGMAACLLILQYVTFQASFDDFHANAPHLYRVVLGKDEPGRWVTPPALAPMLRREFPQVRNASRMDKQAGIVAVGQHVFTEEEMCWVDNSFLTMFSFPLRKGNPAVALSRPHTAVISPAIARKYFGDADPVGKVFTLNGERTFQVTGVLEDLPQYSHLQFDFLLSYATPRDDAYYEQEWGSRGFPTYVQLAAGADPRTLEKALPVAVKKHTDKTKELSVFHLQPLQDIHLSTEIKEANGVDPAMLYFLLLLALFILVVAWINYINLATARATERAREVGVRKAMGAGKTQLLRQFLLESVLLNALGIVLAFTLVQGTLPYFRQLTGLDLSLTLWYDPLFWVGLVSLLVAGTGLSGLYPAVVLASFNPVTVLKGSGTGSSWRKGIGLRQGLVVFQFATCIVLIVGTAAVYLQTEYMRNQDLGLDAAQTLVLKGPRLVGDSTTRVNRWRAFRQAVRETGLVREITASEALPSRDLNRWTYLSLAGAAGQSNNGEDIFPIVDVEADFFRAFDIKVLAGRTFSAQLSSDTRTVVLNEEAAKHFGFAAPHQALNRQLNMGDAKFTVIGVIANFHHQLRDAYVRTAFVYNPAPGRYFSLQLNTGSEPAGNVQKALTRVEQQWKQTYPGNPFDYFFLDDSFDAQFRADQKFGRTVALFAFLTILVACLGLFGLASFTTTQRTREIGIRKALGATMGSVLFLLSRDFLRLVLLANLLAWPLAYWAIRKWLQGYAFPITLSPWLFILPAVAVLLIALLTVSYKTWQAARQNPVTALRHE